MHDETRSRFWGATTVAMLAFGYAGYYVCRAYLSVYLEPIGEALGGPNDDPEIVVGVIASVGTAVYALGKLLSGTIIDVRDPRTVLLVGMVGASISTMVFGLSTGFSLALAAWSVNRLVQSAGWGATMKIAANWIRRQERGRLVGYITLSYLLGDALVRIALGLLARMGVEWREALTACAWSLAVIALLCAILLRSSPSSRGLPELPEDDEGVVRPIRRERPSRVRRPRQPAAAAVRSTISGPAAIMLRGLRIVGDVHAQLLMTPGFYLICIVSFLLTITREAMTTWLPTYLKVTQNFSLDEAAFGSAVFPAAGAVSSLVVGHATDWTFRRERGGVMVVSLLCAAGALAAMAVMPEGWPAALQLVAIAVVGLTVLGPYALLSGSVAMDLGGRSGVATTANVVDAVGYAGAVVAGSGVAVVVIQIAWQATIGVMAVLVLVAALVSGLYWWIHERRRGGVRRVDG